VQNVHKKAIVNRCTINIYVRVNRFFQSIQAILVFVGSVVCFQEFNDQVCNSILFSSHVLKFGINFTWFVPIVYWVFQKNQGYTLSPNYVIIPQKKSKLFYHFFFDLMLYDDIFVYSKKKICS
jgi:hypothetical protein